MADDEPMLIRLIRQRMEKKQKVARYIRSGDRSVPVWMHSFRPDEKTYADGKQKVWTFKGYQGYREIFTSYRDDTFDRDYELIPGKTKNTWQIKRRAAQVTEGQGEDVLAFAEYLRTARIKPEKARPRFEVLATMLFQRGWKYATSVPGVFMKGPLVIRFPRATWQPKNWHSVNVRYHDTSTLPPSFASETHHVDDVIANLDTVLDEVGAMVK